LDRFFWGCNVENSKLGAIIIPVTKKKTSKKTKKTQVMISVKGIRPGSQNYLRLGDLDPFVADTAS